MRFFPYEYLLFSDEEAEQVEMVLFIYVVLHNYRFNHYVINSPKKLSQRTFLILLHHTNYVKAPDIKTR